MFLILFFPCFLIFSFLMEETKKRERESGKGWLRCFGHVYVVMPMLWFIIADLAFWFKAAVKWNKNERKNENNNVIIIKRHLNSFSILANILFAPLHIDKDLLLWESLLWNIIPLQGNKHKNLQQQNKKKKKFNNKQTNENRENCCTQILT